MDRNWGRELADGRRRDGAELRLICPFIKTRAVVDLLGGVQPQTLEVVTQFNLEDFFEGVSDVAALRAIVEAGGRVRGVHKLHAKIFLFGESRAAVTSANLTHSGLSRNHEFGCVSEERKFVDACRSYFDQLWGTAGPDLTLEQLREWDIRINTSLAGGGPPRTRAMLPDFGVIVDRGL